MKKQLFYAPLWGIFALSLLSSCRTEDNFTQQNNQQDKRFAVFVPKKGKQINYADGFTYLMKKSDNLHKTNLSGINNQPVIGNFNAGTEKNASVVQNAASYVEFNVRSQTITEENGDKWLIYAKVHGNKVVGLIAAILSNKETYVAYKEIDQQHVLYTQNIFRFQLALDKYQKHKILSSAKAAAPPPGGSDGDSGCGSDVKQCGNVEEVNMTTYRTTGVIYIDVWLGITPGEGGGGCGFYDNCSPGDGSGGGGGDENEPVDDKIDVEELKDYPCAYAIAQELPNLKNDLADALNKIFKNSDKYNITFKAVTMKPTDKDVDGVTDSFMSKEFGSFKSTISLNDQVLANATKEYILVTMYHEVVHAYLKYELFRLGKHQFDVEYPGLYIDGRSVVINGTQVEVKTFLYKEDHQQAAAFINTLQSILMSYNPNLSGETARILSKAGMVNLTSDEKKVNDRERGVDKTFGQPEGTKCTK